MLRGVCYALYGRTTAVQVLHLVGAGSVGCVAVFAVLLLKMCELAFLGGRLGIVLCDESVVLSMLLLPSAVLGTLEFFVSFDSLVLEGDWQVDEQRPESTVQHKLIDDRKDERDYHNDCMRDALLIQL